MSTLIELESACHRLIAENAELKAKYERAFNKNIEVSRMLSEASVREAELKRTVASFELAMKRLVEKYAGEKAEAQP